jgi:3-dehydroquinate synthase
MVLTLEVGRKQCSRVVTGGNALLQLDIYIRKSGFSPGSVFILADSNTKKQCLPRLLAGLTVLTEPVVMVIPAGEESKTAEMAAAIWESLTEQHAGRDSLLICLGGGVVTDLGGFVASTYKRGIRFVHVPTTLMGMADAAIGGKTAVNVNGIKNAAGTFAIPEAVYIHTGFLSTLKKNELLSGFAELLKYGLIFDKMMWDALQLTDPKIFSGKSEDAVNWEPFVRQAVELKLAVVRKDFSETGLREILNFGHTLGHAIETVKNENGRITHGHAVAAGMICEAFISAEKAGLTKKERDAISTGIARFFPAIDLAEKETEEILKALLNDKKNRKGSLRFTLLEKTGSAKTGFSCTELTVRKALSYCKEIYSGKK